MNIYLHVFIVVLLTLIFGCNDSDSKVGESCGDPGDVMYCEDEQSIIECTNCKEDSRDFCWKRTGCGPEFRCRYLPVERGEDPYALCLKPEDPEYKISSDKPYKEGQ